jgi:hypothetical protein
MVSYSHRLQSGHFMCYLNRTYHVLLTCFFEMLDKPFEPQYRAVPCSRTILTAHSLSVPS